MSNNMFDGEVKQLLKFKRVIDDEERVQQMRVFRYIGALEAAVKAGQEMHRQCPADADATPDYAVAVKEWGSALENLASVQESIREDLTPKVPYQEDIESMLRVSGFHHKGPGRVLVGEISKLMTTAVAEAVGRAAEEEMGPVRMRKT